ncbi:hypothetical protein [Tumebacillus lipolyticus]|uniref:Thioredoxin domain-containing protein n=1 Tax=Tumebacillus lipolyticus TaxID=1280370 RepID=A0ABW5A0M0_9BACL
MYILFSFFFSMVVAAILIFLSRCKKTLGEIALLPRYGTGAVDVHPLVGKHISHIDTRIPLPENVKAGWAIVMLMSATCPYCLNRMEEFHKLYLPQYSLPHVCLVQVEEEGQLQKFRTVYERLPLIPVSGMMFQELELNLIPGFLLVDEKGTIVVAVSRIGDLESETAKFLRAHEQIADDLILT